MRKLLLIVLLTGLFVSESIAKVQVGVGVSAGPNLGRWKNQYFSSKFASAGGTLNYQFGVHAGIQARVWFNKYVGLNLAGEFNMGGNTFTRYTGQGNSVFLKQVHKDNQVTVPLTAMVGWGNERLRVFGNVGGYFGYILSSTDKLTETVSGSEAVVAGGPYNYNKIDAGVRMGAGLQIYVGKSLSSSVTFDVNYDLGVIKTFKDGTPDYFKDPQNVKLTNSKLMVGVGYIYSFGKKQSEEKPKRITDVEEPAKTKAKAK